jgi:alanine racemase
LKKRNKYRNRFSKKEKEHVFLKGLCTHMVPKVLPTIIELISKLKIRRYLSISCKNELKPEIRHSACSAASIMFPATRMDMVE